MKRDGFSDAALFLSAFAVAFIAAFVIGLAILRKATSSDDSAPLTRPSIPPDTAPKAATFQSWAHCAFLADSSAACTAA